MKKKVFIVLMGLIVFSFISASIAQEAKDVVTLKLTDKVLVKDLTRFGLNTGMGDSVWFSAGTRKKRIALNFEGSSYRQCCRGELFADGYASYDGGMPKDEKQKVQQETALRKMYVGLTATILSGPVKGTKVKIVDVGWRKRISVPYRPTPTFGLFFKFDKKLDLPARIPVKEGMGRKELDVVFAKDTLRTVGLMIEHMDLSEGTGKFGARPIPDKDNPPVLVNNDAPAETFGSHSILLDATEKKTSITLLLQNGTDADVNGKWVIRYWAKTKAGSPKMNLTTVKNIAAARDLIWKRTDNKAPLALPEPTKQWKQYTQQFNVVDFPELKSIAQDGRLGILCAKIGFDGGSVLLDDIEVWQEGDTNPTAFRDDAVNMLKRYKPGILRALQMGGETIENTIKPCLQSFSVVSKIYMGLGPENKTTNNKTGLHEFFELCEEIDAEPWYCLPGTLHPDEMARFMEYIGAPANVGLGKLRAKLGHPKPWTKTLRKIHVEYGNEAWNGAGYSQGGFNGRDYWEGLMSTGKKSSYYSKNVIFHAGGWALNGSFSTKLAKYHPSLDRVAIAPYAIHHYTKAEEEFNSTTEKLFRWSFGTSLSAVTSGMSSQHEFLKTTGKELSIYEVAYHTTGGNGSLDHRRKFIASIGGGVNMANYMLHLLKNSSIRSQCLFNFNQRDFPAAGMNGSVPLWGNCLFMKKGKERVRPLWLAMEMINEVIGKDLVQTLQTGATPTFVAEGLGMKRGGKPQPPKEFPAFFHYAFQDGQRRAIVLVNLDIEKSHPVKIDFDGDAVGSVATSMLLTSDKITDNNELDSGEEATVKSVKSKINAFKSGSNVKVPPFSIMTLEWKLAK